ncbi:MAG: lipid A-modifier LpxR family protein, partial [Acidimicrobiia bacterium]
MKQTLTIHVLLLATIALPARAVAQTQPLVSSAAVFVENDVVPHAGDNNDQNYTGGFGFLFNGRFITSLKLNSGVDLLDRLTGVSRATWDGTVPRYSFLLYGSGFTPDRLNDTDVVVDDRPYASIVGISIRKLSVEPADQNSSV